MKTLLPIDVRDAALKRIEWSFDHYERVVVGWSGGKDSTVVLHLTLEVAREKGRLPLDVMWLDQEAEWDATVQLARKVRDMDEVNFHWYQVPFRLQNSASVDGSQPALYCWGPGEEWMREREADSIHENTYGEWPGPQFKKLLDQIQKKDFAENGDVTVCTLTGIRADESYHRFLSLSGNLTANLCYISVLPDVVQEEFEDIPMAPEVKISPIYDFSDADIWKAIHDGEWEYCTVYDTMYQMGIARPSMRVSSLCHDIAISSPTTKRAMEIEPDTWPKLVERVHGMNNLKHMKVEEMMAVVELPEAFRSWRDYRSHIMENLVSDDGEVKAFLTEFKKDDKMFSDDPRALDWMICMHVSAILRGLWSQGMIQQYRGQVRNWLEPPGEYYVVPREGSL